MMTRDPDSFSPRRLQRERAFTIIELLVAVAVLALLLTLRLSALASAKDQTLRGQCAGHLRAMALATTIIAKDNGDKLPSNNGGAFNWPWDMVWSLGNTLTNYMSVQTLYCPASGFNSADNINLWNYGATSFHVTGYAQTLPGTGLIVSTNLNSTLTPQRVLSTAPPFRLLPAPLASQRVLFADSVISIGNTLPPSPSDNFSDIAAGYIKHHRTCHMDGALPAGGNLAMLDGHVEWRKFQLMAVQGGGSGDPYWWW